MTLPVRRTPAALLQVDAILSRLDGRPALDEVARYLLAEFAELAAVSFYRADPPPTSFAGGTVPEGRTIAEIPPSVDEAVRVGRRVDDPATAEVAVPVREGERTAGVVLARASKGPLDAVDGRFLAEIAKRSSGAIEDRPKRLL